MENLAKKVSKAVAKLNQELVKQLPNGGEVCLGFSGGIDSATLLNICVKNISRKFKLKLLHVNHNIDKDAKQWADHCQLVAKEYSVPIEIINAKVNPQESSLEERAREVRLAAFNQQNAKVMLLAHHANDQAETVLLRIFRGCGVHGLSAMKYISALPGSYDQFIIRPLLNFTSDEIQNYANENKIKYIDDPSNLNLKHNRNWLRNEVIKNAIERFPGAVASLNQAAKLAQESAHLIDSVVETDEQNCKENHGYNRQKIIALGEVRIKNWLRGSLQKRGLQSPSHKHIAEACKQICHANAKFELDFDDIRLIGNSKFISWETNISLDIDKIEISQALEEEK